MAIDHDAKGLNVGDKVRFFDNSYSLRLGKMGASRRHVWNNEVDCDLIDKGEVVIVEVDLKVPAMHPFKNEISLDEGNPVFLNLMVKDNHSYL